MNIQKKVGHLDTVLLCTLLQMAKPAGVRYKPTALKPTAQRLVVNDSGSPSRGNHAEDMYTQKASKIYRANRTVGFPQVDYNLREPNDPSFARLSKLGGYGRNGCSHHEVPCAEQCVVMTFGPAWYEGGESFRISSELNHTHIHKAYPMRLSGLYSEVLPQLQISMHIRLSQ